MDIRDARIDEGKAFDWGKTSEAYAKYRDIYPEEFYRKLLTGVCALRAREFWTLEQERACCRATCISSEQNG